MRKRWSASTRCARGASVHDDSPFVLHRLVQIDLEIDELALKVGLRIEDRRVLIAPAAGGLDPPEEPIAKGRDECALEGQRDAVVDGEKSE